MSWLPPCLVLLAGFMFFTGTVCAAEPPEEQTSRRTDLYGDPMLEGAIARLGTVRFSEPYEHFCAVAFAADGKSLAAVDTPAG